MNSNLKKIALVFNLALLVFSLGMPAELRAQLLQPPSPFADELQKAVNQQIQEALQAAKPIDVTDIELDTETKTPLPGAKVTVLASLAAGGDPGKVNFIWDVDGQTVLDGFGERRLNLNAKNAVGQQTLVEVTALFENHKPITKSLTLTVADLLLTFKPASFVPTGYRGLNLPAVDAQVTVTALPLLDLGIDPASLKFSWQLNGRTITEKYGAKTISFLTETGTGNSNDVTVEVSDPGSSIAITKNLRIPIVNPEVILYPEQGSFKAVAGKEISANERGLFFAQPYFFSAKTNNLEFRWEFLNQKTAGLGQEFSNLRYTGPSKEQVERLGTTPLRLNVRNPGNGLQQASVVVPMRFK